MDVFEAIRRRRSIPQYKKEPIEEEKLDKFLASLLIKEGIKVSLQEAISLIVDYALENEEAIVAKLKEMPPWRRTPHGKLWKILGTGG